MLPGNSSPCQWTAVGPKGGTRTAIYVQGVVSAFGKDERVLGWDIWNEPVNKGGDKDEDVTAKVERINELLPEAFSWARAMYPTQPLTGGVWVGNWSDRDQESKTTQIQLAESDVISFHNYGWPEEFEARIRELQRQGRSIICTEYLARGNASNMDGSLPIAKSYAPPSYQAGSTMEDQGGAAPSIPLLESIEEVRACLARGGASRQDSGRMVTASGTVISGF